MKKLLLDRRSYQNRLPGTVTPHHLCVTKLDYNSWRPRGQRGRDEAIWSCQRQIEMSSNVLDVLDVLDISGDMDGYLCYP